MHKILLTSPMRYICARFVQDRISFSNGQYMCKIFARLTYFPNVQYIRKICARLYLFPNAQYMCKICARCTSFSNVQYMRKICARLYFFLQCAIYSQDLCKIVLYLFPQCAVYMCKICARLYFFLQCEIFAHDCIYFPNAQYMCKICTRLYFFLRCAIYAQDLHKIVLISQCVILRNICARFVQDCTSLSNVQYMHKIAGIIGKKYATYHISAPNLEWYSLHSYFWIATSFHFFLHKHLMTQCNF